MIKLVLTSASNFTKELLDKYNLSYLKCEIVYKDKHYPSSLTWDYLSKEELINYMKNGGIVSVAQPPVGEWVKELNELLKEDRDIVCLLFSEKIGGAVRAFNIAKSLIKTDKKLNYVEINGGGPCEELFALELVDFIKEDTSFEEIKSFTDDLNSRLHYYAISESMRQWAYTGRSNDKKVEVSYPKGLPVIKDTGKLLGLYESFDKALEKFKEDTKQYKATKCVINYVYDTYSDWIDKFEKTIIDTLGCKIIAKNEQGPTNTCIEGINSVNVAFI